MFTPANHEIQLSMFRAPFGATRADADFRVLESEPALILLDFVSAYGAFALVPLTHL